MLRAVDERQLGILARRCAREQIKIMKHETDFAIATLGMRRGPAENGFADVDAGCDFAAISAVTTRSPSFNPSMTSVTTPSLIPVLICTGVSRLLDKT